ncbi:MAG: hypothetical protein AAGA66_00455 [Bacteroidota bacterium]
MRKIIQVVLCLMVLGTANAQNPLEPSYEGYWEFSDYYGRYFYVHFTQDNDLEDDFIQIVDETKGSPLSPAFNVFDDKLASHREIYLFADRGSIDSLIKDGAPTNFLTLSASNEKIGFGQFAQEPVSGFAASVSKYTGKINLSWTPYYHQGTLADGYLIFKKTIANSGNEYANEPIKVINDGNITSYDDFDVVDFTANTYYIVAFHVSQPDKRFVSYPSMSQGTLKDLDYSVMSLSEEVVIHRWIYDNSILEDREFGAINTAFFRNGENVYDADVNIAEYNLANARINFNALELIIHDTVMLSNQLNASGEAYTQYSVLGNAVKAPFTNGYTNSTLEFWLDVGALQGNPGLIMSASVATDKLLITSEGLYQTSEGEPTTFLAHGFRSHTWYHFALVEASGATHVFINGSEIGAFPTRGTLDQIGMAAGFTYTIPSQNDQENTMPDVDGNDMDYHIQAVRLGPVRGWSVPRTQDQIRQDQYDVYTATEVVNLENQWIVPDDFNSDRLTGLIASGEPLIVEGTTGASDIGVVAYSKGIRTGKSYIFDRQEVFGVYKERRGRSIPGAYEAVFSEVGSGKQLVSSADGIGSTSVDDLKARVSNQIVNSDSVYDIQKPGSIPIQFFTDSYYPSSYDLLRIDASTGDSILVNSYLPDQMIHSGIYDGPFNFFVFDSLTDLNEFSIAMRFKSLKTATVRNTLLFSGNFEVYVDENNRLFVRLGENNEFFLRTMDIEKWNDLVISVAVDVEKSENRRYEVYLNGGLLGTSSVPVRELDPTQILVQTQGNLSFGTYFSEGYRYELGYLAVKPNPLAPFEFLEMYRNTPDLRTGWEVLYHQQNEEASEVMRVSLSADHSERLVRTSDFPGASINANPSFSFFNNGNLHDILELTDAYTSEGDASLLADHTYDYVIVPNYPVSSFDPSDKVGVVRKQVQTLTTGFQAAYDPAAHQVVLNWSEDLQTIGFDSVRIVRNGQPLATLFKTTEYVDRKMEAAATHTYLLEVLKNNEAAIASEQTIDLEANGALSGWLLSRTGEFVVPNHEFKLVPQGGAVEPLTLQSDENGQFETKEVAYGKSTLFIKEDPDDGDVLLTMEQPRSTDNFLYENYAYGLEKVTTFIKEMIIDTVEDNYLSFMVAIDSTRIPEADGFLNVYINDTLRRVYNTQALILNENTFIDYHSTDSVNTYEFKLYYLLAQNEIVFDSYELEDIGNVAIEALDDLQVTTSAEQYSPELTFTYPPSHKVSGFHVYRDELLLDVISLDPDQETYTYLDPLGALDSAYDYQVIPVSASGAELKDQSSNIVAHVHFGDLDSLLVPLKEMSVVELSTENRLTLATTGHPFQQVPLDGFYVYKGEKRVAQLPVAHSEINGNEATFEFFYQLNHLESADWTLKPYKYYRTSEGAIEQQLMDASIDLVAPHHSPGTHDFQLTIVRNEEADAATTQNFVKVLWEAPDILPDRYAITIDGSTFEVNDPFATSFAWGYESLSTSIEVTLATCSGTVCTEVGTTSTSGETQVNEEQISTPTNFMATHHAASAVALSWEYPDFAFAEFELYRDGEKLDTLLATHMRGFIDADSTLVPGMHYAYQLRAVYQGETSPFLSTAGKMQARTTLLGTVTDKNGRGVPYIPVTIGGKVTYTDGAGAYQMEDINTQGPVEVAVGTPFTRVPGYTKTIDATPSTSMTMNVQYPESFDYYYNEGTLATIPAISAFEDQVGMNNTLFWTTNNLEFEGFEVFRDGLVIGEIDRSEPMYFVDSLAIPGITYEYSVVPFQENTSAQQQEPPRSEVVTVATPKVHAPFGLTAYVPEGEGILELHWVHAYNNLDGFGLVRDGLPLTAPADNYYLEEFAYPGVVSSYTLNGFTIKENVAHSNPQVENAQLTVNTPPVGMVQHAKATTNEAAFGIDLTWEYPIHTTSLSEVVIEREREEIATLTLDQTTFTDLKGVPNTDTKYQIKLVSAIDDITSAAVEVSAWFPSIDSVRSENLLIGTASTADTLQIDWSFDTGNISYFDCYLINTDRSKMDSTYVKVPFTDGQTTYQLKFGNKVPGEQYEISIQSVREVNNEAYYAAKTTSYYDYGGFNPLQSEEVSPLNDGAVAPLAINVIWTYDHFDLSYYELIVNDGSSEDVIRIDPGARHYVYVPSLSKHGQQTDYTFSLLGYKEVDGHTKSSPLIVPTVLTIDATKPVHLSKVLRATTTRSDGVMLEWDTYSISDSGITLELGDVFEIYRDEQKVWEREDIRENAAYSWMDQTATLYAGNEYVYTLQVVDGTTQEVKGVYYPAKGEQRGAAEVFANVISEIAPGAAVKNKRFFIKGKLPNGQNHDYVLQEAVSQDDGSVTFTYLPFQDKNGNPITYDLYTPYEVANYREASQTFAFSDVDQMKGLDPFIYSGADIIQGLVKYENCSNCGLEKVKVNYYVIHQGDTLQEQQTVTNVYGAYSFATFNGAYDDQTIYTLEVERAEGAAYQNPNALNETITFGISDFDDAGFYHRNILDTTSLPLRLRITDPCLESLGDYQFEVRLQDMDNFLYDSTFYTDEAGILELRVPPYNLRATVVNAEPHDSFSSTVLDYFRSRFKVVPFKSRFQGIIEELRVNDSITDLYQAGYDELLLDLQDDDEENGHYVFHRRPDILAEPSNNVTVVSSCEGESLWSVRQNVNATIRFSILEEGCQVKDGYIIVVNSGASKPVQNSLLSSLNEGDPNSTIVFDPNTGTYTYTFNPARPNLVAPYLHQLEVLYLDNDGNLVGTMLMDYLLEGAETLEGSDVIVAPEKEASTENLKVPLYVLRDPPGDHSYSYIKKGTRMNFEIKTQGAFEAGLSLQFRDKFEVRGYGVNLQDEMGFTYSREEGTAQRITLAFEEEIRTSAESVLSTNLEGYLDGPFADVIVGLGAATQYGITEEVYLDGCEVKKERYYDVSANEISTVWYYTRSMIIQTAKYYNKLAVDIAAGVSSFRVDDPAILDEDREALAAVSGSDEELVALLLQYSQDWLTVDHMTGAYMAPPCVMCREVRLINERFLESVGYTIIRTEASELTPEDGKFIREEEVIPTMAGEMRRVIMENTGSSVARIIKKRERNTDGRPALVEYYDQIEDNIYTYLTTIQGFCEGGAAGRVCDITDERYVPLLDLSTGELDLFEEAYDAFIKFKYTAGYANALESLIKYSIADKDHYTQAVEAGFGTGFGSIGAIHSLSHLITTGANHVLNTNEISSLTSEIEALDQQIEDIEKLIAKQSEHTVKLSETIDAAQKNLDEVIEARSQLELNISYHLDTEVDPEEIRKQFEGLNALLDREYAALAKAERDVVSMENLFNRDVDGMYQRLEQLPLAEQETQLIRNVTEAVQVEQTYLDELRNGTVQYNQAHFTNLRQEVLDAVDHLRFQLTNTYNIYQDKAISGETMARILEFLEYHSESSDMDATILKSSIEKRRLLQNNIDGIQQTRIDGVPLEDANKWVAQNKAVEEAQKKLSNATVTKGRFVEEISKEIEESLVIDGKKLSLDEMKALRSTAQRRLGELKQTTASETGVTKVADDVTDAVDNGAGAVDGAADDVAAGASSKTKPSGYVTMGGLVAAGGFATMAASVYDVLRGNFTRDLELIADLNNGSLTEKVGYDLVENITFSGGLRIEKEFDFITSEQSYLDSYWKVEGEIAAAPFKDQDIKISTGTPVSHTRNDLLENSFGSTVGGGFTDGQELFLLQDTIRSFEVGYVLEDNDDGDHFNTYVINSFNDVLSTTQLSPYFMLVGGRSSDPFEEGTLSRDYPTIEAANEDGSVPTLFIDEDPDVALVVPIKMTSGNRFDEGRSVSVTIAPNTNNNGAQLLLSNAEIFTGRANSYFIEAGEEALFTNLLVEPRPGIFEYPDIELVIRPLGVKDDFFAEGEDVFDTLALQVNFRKPVSTVSLSDREGPWFINAKEANDPDDTEAYVFYLEGYDVEGNKSGLSFIKMEYKPVNADALDWEPMIQKRQKINPTGPDTDDNLTGGSDTVGIARLYQFYEDFKRTYNEPTYPYVWSLDDQLKDVVDGEYLVRATAFDERGLFSFSNIYTGVIDRKRPRLLAAPEPADGVLSLGDQVFVSLNESMNDDLFYEKGDVIIRILHPTTDELIEELYFREGEDLFEEFDVVVSDKEFSILFDEEFLKRNDGRKVSITASGIYDDYDNPLEGEVVEWSFIIDEYKYRPSPAVVIAPGEGFIENHFDDEALTVTFSDYDVYNTFSDLESIAIEVQRNGGGWQEIGRKDLAELQANYERMQSSDQVPTDSIQWKLTTIDDGNFDIRARAISSYGYYVFSNTVSGRVDRTLPVVSGNPQPADRILGVGEVASVRFSEAIDQDTSAVYYQLRTGTTLLEEGNDYTVSLASEVWVFNLTEEATRRLKGDSVIVSVSGIFDLAGNALGYYDEDEVFVIDTVSWAFVVDDEQIPVSTISLQNDDLLVNTQTEGALDLIMTDYDAFSTRQKLDRVDFQYKRMLDPDWVTFGSVSQSELKERFNDAVDQGWLPADAVPVDTIAFDTQELRDGTYRVRALAYGGNQFNVSNLISLVVDRKYPQIKGTPAPVDQVLSINDQAAISFTEPINYSLLPIDSLLKNITVMTQPGGDVLEPDEMRVAVASSSIQVSFSQEVYDYYFSKSFTLQVDGVKDLYGNPLLEEATWTLRLDRFNYGPSDVTITEPSFFVSNIANQEDPILITIEGYDIGEITSEIDQFVLQYKLAWEDEAAWQDADTLTRSQLKENYEALASGQPNVLPRDVMYVDPALLDGQEGLFEVRVVSEARGRQQFSNIVSGVVDYTAPEALAMYPTLGYLGRQDVIRIVFNEMLDISDRTSYTYEVSMADGTVLGSSFDANFDFVLSDREISIVPQTIDLLALDGEALTVRITGIKDLAGNTVPQKVLEWQVLIAYDLQSVSPVSIQPPMGLVINAEREAQQIVVKDFALNNAGYLLDSIAIYYATASDPAAQVRIGSLNETQLQAQNTDNEGGLEAEISWQLQGEAIEDATLSLQAYAYATLEEGATAHYASEPVSVRLDRTPPSLVAFHPMDGVFSRNDEIVVTISEAMDVSKGIEVTVTDPEGNDADVYGAFFIPVMASNQVRILKNPAKDFSTLQGKDLVFTVRRIEDLAGNPIASDPSKEVRIDNFSASPSPVELVGDDPFVLNLADPTLQVKATGFDPFELNYELDSLELQYRRTADDQEVWMPVASKDSVALKAEASLLDVVAATSFSFSAPPEDGVYELRVVSYGAGQYELSNTITGRIDRVRPEVLGNPNPEDQVLRLGETLSMQFTEDVQIGELLGSVRNLSKDTAVTAIMTYTNDGLSVLLEAAEYAKHIGDALELHVMNVMDLAGNLTEEDTISWAFRLDPSRFTLSEVSLAQVQFVVSQATADEVGVTYKDFDLETRQIDSMVFQYRKEPAGTWTRFESVNRGLLQQLAFNQSDPQGTVVFETTGLEDGAYEIRAIVYGIEGLQREGNNRLHVTIDRVGALVSTIEKSEEGEITVTFTEPLSKDLSEAVIEVRQMVNGISAQESGRVSATQAALSNYAVISPAYYDVSVVAQQVWVRFSEVMKDEFAGHEVELFVRGLKDQNENLTGEDVYTSMVLPERSDSTGTNLQGSHNGSGAVMLTWRYSGLIRSDGLELERMHETVFEPIMLIDNLMAENEYRYEDNVNYAGDMYYRLKFTGTEDVYSRIVNVSLAYDPETIPIATVYPNPSIDRSKIQFRLLTRNLAEGLAVKIYSESGSLLKEQEFSSEEIAQAVFVIDFNHYLAEGVYYVEVAQGAHLSIERVLIK